MLYSAKAAQLRSRAAVQPTVQCMPWEKLGLKLARSPYLSMVQHTMKASISTGFSSVTCSESK